MIQHGDVRCCERDPAEPGGACGAGSRARGGVKLTRFVDTGPFGSEESTMAKTRLPYTPEFRRQMVALVGAGRTPEELATEFEPTAQSIRNWVAQSERNAGRGDGGLTTAEREELNRLRRENRQLRVEREILSKAAAWFARETNAIPAKGSGS
jgi:transposase